MSREVPWKQGGTAWSFPALVCDESRDGGFFCTKKGGKMPQQLTAHEVLHRGVEHVLPGHDVLEKLMNERKIRLYLGIDPTGNQLHLGHSVVLRKLQQFAELGHDVILLIGNGTVKIGDPTGRDKTRPVLTDEDIEANFQTWKAQASKILDFDRIRILYNGDWLDQLKMPEVIRLLARTTLQQLMERDMFQERLKAGLPIFTHELIYPLLQGYDSVVMDVDLELGGNDQLFNMMMGRQLQRDINNREKYVLTVPLLVGSDGRKMGKSFGNFISMTETAENMFGKLMSVSDEVLPQYFELLTDLSWKDVDQLKSDLNTGALHPMEAKKKLAFDITQQYHGAELAQEAQAHFERTVQNRELPTEIPEISVSGPLSALDLVMLTNVVSSRSEARRLIEQGGATLDDERFESPLAEVSSLSGQVLRVGKRQYFKIR